MINSFDVPKGVDVVVAPPALFLDRVMGGIRKDVAVASQVREIG